MTARASRQRDRRETNPAFNTAGSSSDLPDQPRQRLRDVGPRRPARHHLAQHGRARQARRGDGVRGAGAGRALARLRRRHQSARPRLRGLYLGRRHRRLDQQARRVRHLAHLAQSPDRRRQAVGGDRPHLRRPLRAQHRDRMEPAGDRHVRQPDDGTRGPLRLRRGMDLHHQAAVDRGRRVRPRGTILQDQPRATCSPSRSRPPIRRS